MTDLGVLQLALEQAHKNAAREDKKYRHHIHEALYHLRQARQHAVGQEGIEVRTDGGVDTRDPDPPSWEVVSHPAAERELGKRTASVRARIEDILRQMSTTRDPSTPRPVKRLERGGAP